MGEFGNLNETWFESSIEFAPHVFYDIRSIVTTGRRSRAAYAAQINHHDCECSKMMAGSSPAAHVVECCSVHSRSIGDEATSWRRDRVIGRLPGR